MGVRETLFLLGIVSSTCATIISQQCWYDVYVLHQAEAVPKLGASCLCPPLHGYEVSQAIKKANSDLERVVVFYYRDKANNDMYMFTPSKDKQFSIPELSFGKDDDLYKINSDFTLRPFEASPITILVNAPNGNPSSNHYLHQKVTNAQDQLVKIDHSSNVLYDQKNGPHIITVDRPNLYDQNIEKLLEITGNQQNPWHDQKQGQNVITIDYPNLEITGNLQNSWQDLNQGQKVVTFDYPNIFDQNILQNIEVNGNLHNAWYDPNKKEPNVGTIDYPNIFDQNILQNIGVTGNSQNPWQDLKPGQNVVKIDYPNIYDQNILQNIEVNGNLHSAWYDPYKKEQNVVTIDNPNLYDAKIENNVETIVNSFNPWHNENLVTDITNLYDQKNKQILDTNIWRDSFVPVKPEQDGKADVVLHSYESYDEWAKQTYTTNFKTWYSQQTTQLPELIVRDSQHISIEELQSHLVNLLKRYGYCLVNNQVLNINREPVDLSHYRLIRVIIRAPEDGQHLAPKVLGVMLVNMSPLTILGVVPLRHTFDETSIQGWDDEVNVLGKYNINLRNSVQSNETMKQEDEDKSNDNEESLSNLYTKLGNVLGHIVPSTQTGETTRRDSGEEVLPGFRIIGGNAATGSGTPITSKGRSAAP